MKITESKIERRVTDFCRKEKLYCRKFASPAQRGVPDRLIVGPQGVLFLELKRPGNEPTPLQRREIKLIKEAGGTAGWSNSSEVSILAIKHYCLGKPQTIASTMDGQFIDPMNDDRVAASQYRVQSELTKPKKTRRPRTVVEPSVGPNSTTLVDPRTLV